MKTSLILEQEPTPAGLVVRALLRLEGDAPLRESRVPINLSLVLDRSGSMSGEPLEAAKRAAIGLVRRLDPADVVSVVAYGSDVETICPPSTAAEQPQVTRAIEAIDVDGMTNLSGGWLRGRELVGARRRDEGVNRVLLLTDGQANEGITEPAALAGLCRTAAEQGITTTTVGFGAQFNEHLLRLMADAGGGSTYYIEQADQAVDVFAQEIEGLLSLSAQNVRVEIRPAPAAQLTLVHHAYRRRPSAEGLTLELGDLYAREPRTLLVEFLVAAAPEVGETEAAETEVAALSIHADVLSAEGGLERREVRLPIRVSAAAGAVTHPEVRREILLLEAARAREEALQARATGELHEGGARLRSTAERLRAQAASAPLACRLELEEQAEDLAGMAERFEERSVSEADAKYLFQQSYGTIMSKKATSRVIRRPRPGDPSAPAQEPGDT
jgi:Ca-activated chloride channel homolog